MWGTSQQAPRDVYFSAWSDLSASVLSLQNRRILSSTDAFMGSRQVCVQDASSRSLSAGWIGRKGNGIRTRSSSQKKGSQIC